MNIEFWLDLQKQERLRACGREFLSFSLISPCLCFHNVYAVYSNLHTQEVITSSSTQA